MATDNTIVNYDHTVIRIVNYDPKTFIVQATGLFHLTGDPNSQKGWIKGGDGITSETKFSGLYYKHI